VLVHAYCPVFEKGQGKKIPALPKTTFLVCPYACDDAPLKKSVTFCLNFTSIIEKEVPERPLIRSKGEKRCPFTNINAKPVEMSLNACAFRAMVKKTSSARPAAEKRRKSSYPPSVPFLQIQAMAWAAAPALHTPVPLTGDSPEPDPGRQFAVPAGQ